MNKEIAAKWAAALRSGKYQQGIGRLRQNEKFCCLGVLCDLYRQETGRGQWEPNEIGDGTMGFALERYSCPVAYPPLDVEEWIGTQEREDISLTLLAADNDTGKDFAYIASQIESKAGLR